MIFIPSVTLTFFSNIISNESSPGLRQALGGKPFSQAADPGPPGPLPTGPAGSHQGPSSLLSGLLSRPETEPTPHWPRVSHVPAQDQSQGSLARPALIGHGRTGAALRMGSDPPKGRGDGGPPRKVQGVRRGRRTGTQGDKAAAASTGGTVP